MREWRPWGHFEVLYSDERTWLKRLMVNAGQRLSAQRHSFRDEYWLPLQSGGHAILDGQRVDLLPGVVYTVPAGMVHRICNETKDSISLMEWAVGTPLESDIERLLDDYGRGENK